jgi:crotonobetainyl-CoA:carnitine CoA-transferase CaiB-like acyl-CoA transferase
VNIAVGNDRLFQKLCEALGMPEAAADPRFTTNADRNANKAALYEALEANLGNRTTAEVVELLDKAGVPCGPINDIAQVFDDPQSIHSQMRQSAQHSTVGEIGLTGFPYRVGGEPLQVRTPPPVLGEQSEEILTELGFTAGQIEAIIGTGS